MKLPVTLLFIFLSAAFVKAQPQWTSRQSLPVSARRSLATSFALNGKIYVVGGEFNFSAIADVWAYDIATNSWAQKADFPGGPRESSVAFTIGAKAYFMTGVSYMFLSDVWEYDATADLWTQRGDFPGGVRKEAIGFEIGGKGYFGTGYAEFTGPNSTSFTEYNDFWEYTPATDTWLQKAPVPGPLRGWAIGGAAGGKGYAGLGGNGTQDVSYSDFYEYDPAADTWTQKASYGTTLSDAAAFTLGSDLYVCGGINFFNYIGSAATKKFDAASDTWVAAPSMPAGPSMGAVAVSTGSKAFVGTGYNTALQPRNDWWEFSIATCTAPLTFSAAPAAANNTVQCNGSISISDINGGCPPYTFSIQPAMGVITSGLTGFVASNLCPGTYSLYLTDANCCGTTFTLCEVANSLANGIAEQRANEQALLVSPNPNTGVFTVLCAASAKTELRLVNALGQEVPVSTAPAANGFSVQLLKQQAGIYFLQAISNGKIVSSKVVVE